MKTPPRGNKASGGSISIRLDPDVYAVFPDSRAVNEALRELIAFRNKMQRIIESAAKRIRTRAANT